jgi:PPOX class probable F420-dependent enzyme
VERAEAQALVEGARVARLATVNPGLGVDVVPITFALLDGGDRLVTAVDQKPKSTTQLRRLANIAAHPEVTVLVDHYEDEWDRLWWVRLRGAATVVSEGPAFDAAIAALTERYDQYVAEPPPGPAISVAIEEWTGWSARSST